MRARGVCAVARIAFGVVVSRTFDRPVGCFSPFAHATRYAIGLGPVFSLGRDAPPVRAILSNSATAAAGPRATGVSPSVPAFSNAFASRATCPTTVYSGPAVRISLAATVRISVDFCSWAY